MKETVIQGMRETVAIVNTMMSDEHLMKSIGDITQCCIAALRSGNKILFAGNGGSAADCQHLAGELVNRFNFDRPGLPAFALTTDTSVLTSISNDYGYERIFERQVQALGNAGDVFFGLSTSGKSANVLAGLRMAKSKGLRTVGFTGKNAGEMSALCDYCIQIPSGSTPKIQEGHILIGHLICATVEATLFNGRSPGTTTARPA